MKPLAGVPIEPILIDARAAAALCGVARSTFLGWDAAGLSPRPIRLGGRVLWCVANLRDWAAAGCQSREAFEQAKAGAVR
jgi:predicted DNA-binding transcriptional regulator AlpA